MKIELTEAEKEMAISGIVFSSSKPNYLLIQDGLEGGNYVCYANWINNVDLTLVIYDMSLESDTQLISLFGEEVRTLMFRYFYDDTPKSRQSNMNYSQIINNNGIEDLYENCESLYRAISESEDTWNSQPANIVAKKIFIEILAFYFRMNTQTKGKNSETLNIGSTVDEMQLADPIGDSDDIS